MGPLIDSLHIQGPLIDSGMAWLGEPAKSGMPLHTYLYGFMIPFCEMLVVQTIADAPTHWIKELFQPLHETDHGVTPRILNISLLGKA